MIGKVYNGYNNSIVIHRHLYHFKGKMYIHGKRNMGFVLAV